MDFSHLPGGDLIGKGLRDRAGSTETEEALLVSIAAPRFESALECVGQPLEDVLASRARPGDQETPS